MVLGSPYILLPPAWSDLYNYRGCIGVLRSLRSDGLAVLMLSDGASLAVPPAWLVPLRGVVL